MGYWERQRKARSNMDFWDKIALLQRELIGQSRKGGYSMSKGKRERMTRERSALVGSKRCEICKAASNLLHHRNYTCMGKETVYDLMLVCGRCHATIHRGNTYRRMAEISVNTPYQLSLLFDRNIKETK